MGRGFCGAVCPARGRIEVAVLRAVRQRHAGLRVLRGHAVSGVAGAAGGAAAHRPPAGGQPRLVSGAEHHGDADVCEGLCRDAERRAGEAGLHRGLRRELPAPDAAAGEPGGPQRRRLCRVRLPKGPAGAGHHGGSLRPGGRLPRAGHRAVPGLRDEPHQRGPRVGGEGPGGGLGEPVPLLLL